MLQLLSEDTIRRAFDDAATILAEIGVSFENPRALAAFEAAGAEISGMNVRISRELLKDALERMPAFEYEVPEHRVAAGAMFGNVPTVYDLAAGQFRRVNLDDTLLMYQLCETSDLYECVNPSTIDPVGITADDLYAAQLAMTLKYSDKYLSNGARATARNVKGGDIYEGARRAIHMVRDFYENYDEAVMDQTICPMSPLAYDREALDNMLAAIDEEQNVNICPCSLTNLTGPPSIFETVVHDIALALGGVVLVQLVKPGFRISLSNSSGATDMKTMQPTYGTVEATLIQCMFFEFCVLYDIEGCICATLADAAVPDYQAGVETYLSTFLPFYYIDLDCAWCYPGHMAAWRCGNFEKAILDEELMRNINRTFQPLSDFVDDGFMERIALAKEKNTFLTGRTPKSYRRDHHMAQVFTKYGIPQQDMNPAKVDLWERVAAEIEKRVKSYCQPDHTDAQQELLNRFLPIECKY